MQGEHLTRSLHLRFDGYGDHHLDLAPADRTWLAPCAPRTPLRRAHPCSPPPPPVIQRTPPHLLAISIALTLALRLPPAHFFRAQVNNGGMLGGRKGVNLPGANFPKP